VVCITITILIARQGAVGFSYPRRSLPSRTSIHYLSRASRGRLASKAGAEGKEMSAPGSPWTPEEDGLLRSIGAAGESVVAIAKRLKRSSEAVRKRAHKLKIKLARSPPGRKAKRK
jgi:DNA-binding NarL/FixJ family response regulator